MSPRKMLLSSTRKAPPASLTFSKPTNRQLSTIKELLLHSPIPSPSLPALLPRHGKKPPALSTRKYLRAICWLTLFATVYVLYQRLFSGTPSPVHHIHQHENGQSYEMVEDLGLPEYSSPLVVSDRNGESRWTIYLPANGGFPLDAEEYSHVCSHVQEVSSHVASQRKNAAQVSSLNYYDPDPNYIDVLEAQLTDLIPLDPASDHSPTNPICKSSLIYVLDSTDAGLGSSLLGLWLSYGLARHENRAFFIDDTHFAYGRYNSLFSPPPTPKCRPPPPTHRVPCPHLSQHLVVSAATWQYTFSRTFFSYFSTKQIFDMMRTGYEALFHLLPDDQTYVDSRVKHLRTQHNGPLTEPALLAGLHIRRGDRHPEEFQYAQNYIPPLMYTQAMNDLIAETSTSFLGLTSRTERNHTVVLASDDADMYLDTALTHAVRAQERISLASKRQIDAADTAGSSKGLGWERGFFKDAFWNLGVPEHARRNSYVEHTISPVPTRGEKYIHQRPHQSSAKNSRGADGDLDRDWRLHPTEEGRRQRRYIGRAYLLDLAVLAQSDRLVCAVSARGCRILGVMMGWEKVQKGWWKNIDGGDDVGWRAEL